MKCCEYEPSTHLSVFYWTMYSSAVVEHSTNDPDIEGSILAVAWQFGENDVGPNMFFSGGLNDIRQNDTRHNNI